MDVDVTVTLMLCLAVTAAACHDLHEQPVIVRPSKERTVVIAPGTHIDLTCVARGALNLTIKWTFNGSPVHRSEYRVDHPNANISIIYVGEEGQYRCVAEMDGHTTASPAITLKFIGGNQSWTYVAGGCTAALLLIVLVIAWRRGLFTRLVENYITPILDHNRRDVDHNRRQNTCDEDGYEIVPDVQNTCSHDKSEVSVSINDEGESDEDNAAAAASDSGYEQLEPGKNREDYTHILRSLNYNFLTISEVPRYQGKDTSSLCQPDGSMYATHTKTLRLSLSELLGLWRFNTIDEMGEVVVTVNDKDILQIVSKLLRKQDMKLQYPPTVEFQSKKLTNEFAEDGTVKSFFMKLMQALKTEILEGDEPHLGFRKNETFLKSGRYREAGKMVAWSILHSGVGFPYLTISMYDFLVERDIKYIRLEDIHNPPIRIALERIMSCSTTTELRGVRDKETITLIKGEGRSLNCLVIEEKDDLVRHMWRSYMFDRVHMEIEQFKSGLADLGLLAHMAESPDALESLFVHKSAHHSGPLTSRQLKTMYQAVLSPIGTQDREEENDTLVAFEEFLKKCQGNASEVKLGDILRFWTGSDAVPSQGYKQDLTIKFVPKCCFPPSPVANTSTLVLELMRGYSLDQLTANMSNAVLHSHVPGNAFFKLPVV
ncbi:uncharacterized protein LOC124254858 [Haliotis rubra]|uniref:uncharacterized protein LOC124254858 n=1 Tax=Haliotis rubra TaxID=36100 RepID=UPI001EE5F8F0|nr:uncharacterized protein LOC124254858 [Haliotis rubra]